ncbi:MAG TPA: phosphatase PAP2 family protein [Acidimicrobiia bacterium]|nr:phosphatase PAP2 family protein [Acidimicrobiia bacterium]
MTADPAMATAGPGSDAPASKLGRRWRPTRLQYAVAIWLSLVGYMLWKWHLDTNRNHLLIILGTGLMAAGAGSLRTIGRVVIDWAPLFFILAAYDSLRGKADQWFPVHVTPQIHADQFLFGGKVPTVELQHLLFTPGRPHIWDYAAFFVYLSHFFVALIVAAFLWKFGYARFRRFAVLFVALSFAGFATYALFPAAPPWLASQNHALAPTAKIVDEVWTHLGLQNGASLLSARSHEANPVAAIPSLHGAYPVLLMLFFWRSAGRWRWLLPLYPLAMAFSLVYTGEHYVIDLILGWLYAVVVYFVGTALMDRWARRRARVAPEPPVAAPEPPVLAGAALSSPD